MDKDSRPRIDLAIVEDTKSPPPMLSETDFPCRNLSHRQGKCYGLFTSLYYCFSNRRVCCPSG